MADEPEDELLLTEPLEPDEDEQRAENPEANDVDEEEVLSFGDDADDQEGDTGLVKHLRSELKKRGERLAELERAAPRPATVEVGEKPTIAGCEYDEDKYEAELDAWKDRKRASETQRGQSEDAQEAERKAWEAELDRVSKEKDALGYADSEEAFATVRAALTTAQQAALIQASDSGNTARVIYALAKSPQKLVELANVAVTDMASLAKFAAKVAKLEGQLKVVKRRRAPDPERIERGSGKISRDAPNKALEKAEKDAERTGDRTEVIALKRKLKEQKAK